MSTKITPCFSKKIKSKVTRTNATPPLDDISSSTFNEVTKIKPKFNGKKKVNKTSGIVPKEVQPSSLLEDNDITSTLDQAKTSSEILGRELTKLVKEKKQKDPKQMIKKCSESSKKKTITTTNKGKQSERKTNKVRKDMSIVNKQTSLSYDVQMRSPPPYITNDCIKESVFSSLPNKENIPPSLSDKESTPPSLSDKESTPTSLPDKENTPPSLTDKENMPLSLKSLPPSLEDIASSLSDKESMPSLSDKKSLPSSLSNEETSISPSLIDKESVPPSLWVQCDNPGCLKWRKLTDIVDPAHVPDKWYCSMNKGEPYYYLVNWY